MAFQVKDLRGLQPVLDFCRKHQEALRFLVVGGINTVFGYSIYALGLWLGLGYVLAALVSQAAGTAFNYFTYGKLVFQAKSSFRQAGTFILSYATLYFISIGFLTLLQYFGLNAFVAGIVNSLVMPVASFVANKVFVFKKIRVERE